MDTFVPDEPEARHSVPSGTVTFLFTDIQGSTQLLEKLREEYASVLGAHHELMRAAFAKCNGQEVDTQGDAFFVAFARATEGVRAAVEAQRALAQHAWPEAVELRVRMGLHTGEPWEALEGYVGMDVHRAARIAHVGHGGQVLLSETTTALVVDELPEGVSLLDLGRHLLKDMRRPEHIRQLVIDGLPSEFPPLTSLERLPPVELREPRQVGECPYRGLAAFQEADAPFFHGREAFTERLYEAVRTQPLVAVIVGSSGSGKSSVVFAGLLPKLRESGGWLVVDFRPGSRPFQAGATALLPLLEPELGETESLVEIRRLAEALNTGELSLFDVLERALVKDGRNRRLLLVIDQFEELYTLCPQVRAVRDGVARIWDLDSGEEILTMSGHTNAINSLAYSRDGVYLATVSDDGTVKVWDPVTGEVLHNISTYPVGVGRVLFSPDGTRLITANWDHTVREYLLDIDELVDLARSRLTRTLSEAECQQYLHLERCPAAP